MVEEDRLGLNDGATCTHHWAEFESLLVDFWHAVELQDCFGFGQTAVKVKTSVSLFIIRVCDNANEGRIPIAIVITYKYPSGIMLNFIYEDFHLSR